MPDDEQMVEVLFPTLGINITEEYDEQPKATSPDAVNVVGFEALTQRDRGGSRPGLVRFVDQALPLD